MTVKPRQQMMIARYNQTTVEALVAKSPDCEFAKRALSLRFSCWESPHFPHLHRFFCRTHREQHRTIRAETAMTDRAHMSSDANESPVRRVAMDCD